MLSKKQTFAGLFGAAVVACAIFATLPEPETAPVAASPNTTPSTNATRPTAPSGIAAAKPELDPAEQEQIDALSRRPAGELLGEPIEDRILVKALAAQLRLPQLPGSATAWEVASHLANVADEEHYRDIKALILQREIPPAALDVLIGDAHQRDMTVKLPLFADITEDREHPAYDEAFAALQAYFDELESNGLDDWRTAARQLAQQTASTNF